MNKTMWVMAAVAVLAAGRLAVADDAQPAGPGQWREKAFSKLDTNNDGVISKDEWSAAAETRRQNREEWLKKHPELMKRVDVNGDGVISDEEREAAWKKWKAHRQKMLEKFDTDKDGQLSPAERDTMRAQMRAEWEQAHPDLLKKFDKNGDGTFDPDERKAAWEEWKATRPNQKAP